MKLLKNVLIAALVVSLTAGYGFAQDPVLPGDETVAAEGSTPDYLQSSQSSKEALIDLQQAIENASYVTVNGTQLVLDGAEYKFSHANNYYLFYKPESMIDEIFADANSLGLNVIRTWGFCEDPSYSGGVTFMSAPGVYTDTGSYSGFAKMDYILTKAAEYGIKLIIPLVNNWDDFGGMSQYVEWFLGRPPTYSEHDLFYTSETIKGWYKDYITHFVNRVNSITGIAYRDDPSILMWELGNEPRAYTDATGDILNPWIDEIAQHLQTVDTNHLVSSGSEGWYGYNDGVDFIESHSSPYIDVASMHLFPDYYNLSDTQALQWITDRASDAQNILNKPVYIGEFGKMADRNAADFRDQMKQRDNLYKNIYNTAAGSGVNGLGFWILYGNNYPDYDNFGVYYPTDRSTNRVIKSGSSLFVTSSGDHGKGGGGKGNGKGNNKTTSASLAETSDAQTLSRRDFLKLYNSGNLTPENPNYDLYMWLYGDLVQ